jgi:hypothetical protein
MPRNLFNTQQRRGIKNTTMYYMANYNRPTRGHGEARATGSKVKKTDLQYDWPSRSFGDPNLRTYTKKQLHGKTRATEKPEPRGSKVKKQICNMIGQGRASGRLRKDPNYGVRGQETELGYDWPRQRRLQPTSLMPCRGQGSQPDNQSPKAVHTSLGSMHQSQPRTQASTDTTPNSAEKLRPPFAKHFRARKGIYWTYTVTSEFILQPIHCKGLSLHRTWGKQRKLAKIPPSLHKSAR